MLHKYDIIVISKNFLILYKYDIIVISKYLLIIMTFVFFKCVNNNNQFINITTCKTFVSLVTTIKIYNIPFK